MRLVTRNKFVKCPVPRFYERCVSCAGLPATGAEGGKPDIATVFDDLPTKPAVERDLYEPLCEAINKLCPGYVCKQTSESPDPSDPSRRKVDLAIFRKEDEPQDRAQHWADQAMHIEVKRGSVVDDPFDDTEGAVFQIGSDARSENCAQIASYAQMLFARQDRAFSFTIIVFGHYARIIRWDRSGAIVTERIDIKENPALFAEFFLRFGHMTRAEQGFDTTITHVERDSDDWKKMDKATETKLTSGDHARQLYKNSLEHKDYPRLKICVKCEDAAEGVLTDPSDPWKEYLVGKPEYMVNSVVGRCTRGYVALDADTEEFVWLKDAWRVDLDRITKEGDTLRALQEAQVPNIPTFLCHGDVPDQTTLADKMWDELYGVTAAGSSESVPRMSHLKPHTHYRMVTKEICLPLDAFGSGKQLLELVLDCVIAHQHAYEKLSLLHRDISAGNVLIFEEVVDNKVRRRGILADWELAKKVPKDQSLKEPMRQPDRTGTWQFLSALTLRNSRKPLTLQDDLESFHQLIFNKSCCWITCNLNDVPAFIYKYFDAAGVNKDTNEYVCGSLKFSIMEAGALKYEGVDIKFKSLNKTKKYPLNLFFKDSLSIFRAYYQVVKHDHPNLFREVIAKDVEVTTSSSGSSELERVGYADPKMHAFLDPQAIPEKPEDEGPELTKYRGGAALLHGHTGFINMLNLYIKEYTWPTPDKLATNANAIPYDPEKQAREVAASDVVQSQSGSKAEVPKQAPLPSLEKQLSKFRGSSTTSKKRAQTHSMSRDQDRRLTRKRVAADAGVAADAMGPPEQTPDAGPSAASQASPPTGPPASGSSRVTRKNRIRRGRSEGSRDAQESSSLRRSTRQKGNGSRPGQSLGGKGKGRDSD